MDDGLSDLADLSDLSGLARRLVSGCAVITVHENSALRMRSILVSLSSNLSRR